jgi:glycosyltransferase involved in cell wall biosynthesis
MMKSIRVVAMLEANSITGSAKAVLEFAKEAIRERPGAPRVELSILNFSRGDTGNSLSAAIRNMGVPLDTVFERGRFDAGILPQLHMAIARRRPDVIWSNSVKSHFLVRWAGLNRLGRWVAFHHGYTSTDMKMRAYNQLDRWSLPVAERVLTSSGAFAKELERNKVRSDRIHVQHMPIRPVQPVPQERSCELRHKLGLDSRTRVLLSVGRLSQEKGHADLVRALPKMRELAAGAPLHLVLVGEGPERSRIEKLSRSLGLADAVTLTGHQNDVDSYYAIADVFVLPSHSEGSPNVLLEAMSAGVPVVATAVGGIPEILSDGDNALLVKKNDVAGLASATARVLRDANLRDRLIPSARASVSRKTPEAYFQSMKSIFARAVQ